MNASTYYVMRSEDLHAITRCISTAGEISHLLNRIPISWTDPHELERDAARLSSRSLELPARVAEASIAIVQIVRPYMQQESRGLVDGLAVVATLGKPPTPRDVSIQDALALTRALQRTLRLVLDEDLELPVWGALYDDVVELGRALERRAEAMLAQGAA
jgi:hypothetical protein